MSRHQRVFEIQASPDTRETDEQVVSVGRVYHKPVIEMTLVPLISFEVPDLDVTTRQSLNESRDVLMLVKS